MFDLLLFEEQIKTLYQEHKNEEIGKFYNKAYEQICKETDEILKHVIGCCGPLNLPEEY